MHVFEIVIALLLGGAGLAALARRMATPYPALVAMAGAALALVPLRAAVASARKWSWRTGSRSRTATTPSR